MRIDSGTVVRLAGKEVRKMQQHAESEYPFEACGLLGGVADNGTVDVKEVWLLRNTDRSEEHFSLDPEEQLAAILDMRAKGLSPVGNWHSHPHTPSRPSREDIRLAYDPNAVYMILSLESRAAPNLNAFSVRNGQADWLVLECCDEE
ncbi:MAG: M67 family metallopeptidase [Oscillospiraceae bacterium]|nr:M67 family metallopeptidase [Oscillospiraceae bacterium]